jgi:hypothetical protein
MSLFPLRPEVGEALWLLGAVRVVTAAAEVKRQKSCLRRNVHAAGLSAWVGNLIAYSLRCCMPRV